jgi:hypothetical protein
MAPKQRTRLTFENRTPRINSTLKEAGSRRILRATRNPKMNDTVLRRETQWPPPAVASECKADKSWNTFETTSFGHAVMLDQPEWRVEAIE